MTTHIRLAMMTVLFAAIPNTGFGAYTVTDGLDAAKLKKDNVKIAVVKVKATRVIRPATSKRHPDGSITFTFALCSIDLELIEQLYGEKLTDADLSGVSYSNVLEDNAWAGGPTDPKGCYYLMAWRHGYPCGQGTGVQFWPGPDLPVLIDKPSHPSVKLLIELLAIVNSRMEDDKRKAALDAKKLKQLREAVGMRVGSRDIADPINLDSVTLSSVHDFAASQTTGDWRKDLFPVDGNGKWGFIDSTGTVAIEPAFEQVAYFSEGLAAVRVNRKYGYINKRGKVVVEPTYGYGHFFLGELAGVTFHPEHSDGAGTGYIHRDGQVVWAAEPKAKD